MRRDLFSVGSKKETKVLNQMLDEFEGEKVFPSDNPTYEDPRDVIGAPLKPPRKRNMQTAALSPRLSKEGKSLLKEQKRKLTKKYENLITTLMDRCEDNVSLLTQKESQIAKLKEKLKAVLEYNKLFADENDKLKEQHATMLSYIEECKGVVRDSESRNKDLELRNQELEQRVRTFEEIDRDHEATAIPLVEVCMSCNTRQLQLTRLRETNSRLQADMQALKDLLYRLNVQLAKYQERLRSSPHYSGDTLHGDRTEVVHKPAADVLDSLIASSLGYKQDRPNSEASNKSAQDTPIHQSSGRLVDVSGLLSAQAIAPLFDAYQENLQEKENLILDYEKQFESLNKKSKQIIDENKTLHEKVTSLEEELLSVSRREKKIGGEKEMVEIEKKTLTERAEKAEAKLKEVYELYEDKMQAMLRDYETVHREYFTTKNLLLASETKMSRLDAALRETTVPADLHERRVRDCQCLLEELKHQYQMERERKDEQLAKLQQQKSETEDRLKKASEELDKTKEELATALKNVRLYRKAAVIFRQRLKASASVRRSRSNNSAPLREALMKLSRIKSEIKAVKSRAYKSLEELERRIVLQESRAARAEAAHRREIGRAQVLLEHKESIIRSLIDNVADVEEVRLSQTNTQRLQGIVSDTSPEDRPQNTEEKRRQSKLTFAHGGYYQETRGERRGSHS
ncbi:trichohyalin [Plutella xylostella]|uniref:trichohyalin n=1 Tax=Plutella xylostella TaxID=51655 RepID=UPI0020331728|nr:trichohyalin [Plutella xylostella]